MTTFIRDPSSSSLHGPIWRAYATLSALVASVISMACSPSAADPPFSPPCDSVQAGQCGTACATDTDCPAGLHCGGAASCTADCAAGAQGCGAGFACSTRGRCEAIPGGPADEGPDLSGGLGDGGVRGTDAGTCVAETRRGEGLPLDMFVMWDRSGSMDDDVNGGTKWDLVLPAFEAFLNDAASVGIGVGIQYFPLSDDSEDPDDDNTSCDISDYSVPAVPVAQLSGNAAPISASLRALNPSGRTPTRVALQGAIDHAREWATAHPDRKVVVVLQSDGEPNVCDSTLDAVVDVATAGVSGTPSMPTYVIGVGEELQNLHRIAQAGGTGEAFIVDTTQDTSRQFTDAMNAIRGAALISCDFLIPPSNGGGAIDFGRVNVEFRAAGSAPPVKILNTPSAAACDPQAGGWYYDDPAQPTRIRLCDASCNAVTADAQGQVDILLGCKTDAVVIQ